MQGGNASPHSILEVLTKPGAQYSSRAAQRRALMRRRARRVVAPVGVRAVAGAIVLVLGPGLCRQARGADPGSTLRQYLQARWRGDVQAAQALWDPDDVRRSQALGITYPALEARFDDNLLIGATERGALAASRPAVRDSSIETAWARFVVVLEPARPQATSVRDTLVYHLRPTGESWQITSPYRRLSSNWTAREGRFFKLRSSKLRNVNGDAMARLDAGILGTLERLHTPEMARLRLERVKYEYYLCDSDAELRQMTNSAAPSQYRLAGERIVTRFLPDLNAVVRAVTHLTLRESPVHSAPLLEEGLPAALGMWDGASGIVTVQHAAHLVAEERVDPETVLDTTGWRDLPSGDAVPVAALWAETLLDQLGPERYLDLYRKLSLAHAGAGSGAETRAAIESATSKRGADLVSWLRSSTAGLQIPLGGGCAVFLRETMDRKPVLSWRDPSEKWAMQMFETGDEYTVAIGPYEGTIPPFMRRMIDSLAAVQGKTVTLPPEDPRASTRPPGDPPRIALLFRQRMPLPEAFESALYHQQFSKRQYGGELYGLFITPDSARLYDYRAGLLVGCSGPDCGGAEKFPLYDEKAGHICFRFRRDLLAQPLSNYMAVTLPYTGE